MLHSIACDMSILCQNYKSMFCFQRLLQAYYKQTIPKIFHKNPGAIFFYSKFIPQKSGCFFRSKKNSIKKTHGGENPVESHPSGPPQLGKASDLELRGSFHIPLSIKQIAYMYKYCEYIYILTYTYIYI